MTTVNEKLTSLANAVRTKIGGTSTLTLDEMTSNLNAIAERTQADLIINDTTLTIPAGNYKTQVTMSVNVSGAPADSTNFISEQIHVDSTSKNTFVTLLSGSSFIANNYNNSNLFVGLVASNLDAIDASAYSNHYQWTTMFASNKAMTANSSDLWYGVGIYSMGGKGQTFSSTLQIPYSLNNTSNTNYSYLNVTSSGDIRIYICNYDVLASGDYVVVAGLF